MTYLIVMENT